MLNADRITFLERRQFGIAWPSAPELDEIALHARLYQRAAALCT